MKLNKVALVAGGLLVAACQGLAVGFVNGDFEGGNSDGWDFELTGNGDNRFRAVMPFDMNGDEPFGTSLVARFSVGQDDDDGELGGIRFTQKLALEAGQMYTVSYKWAALNSFPTFSNFDGGTFRLIVDGDILATHETGVVDSMVTYHGTQSATFTASETRDYVIGTEIVRRFKVPFFSDPVMTQYVDDFEIEAVPEPGLMALVGLGVFASIRRKKR